MEMDANLTQDPDLYVRLTIDRNLTGHGDVGGEAQDLNGTAATSIIEFYQKHAPLAVAIDRLISPVFYLIGLPSNPLCAYIWLGPRTRRSNSSAIYLGALSLSHMVFLTLHVFLELNYAWGIKTYNSNVLCATFYILYYLPQYLAPLLVLGFTVERYIAVCHPFVKEKYCTVRRAVVMVLTFLITCLLVSSMQGYMWTFDEGYQNCNHRMSLQNIDFPYYWTWVTEMLLFALPPLAALIFNILVLREIRTITTRGPAGMMSSIRTQEEGGGGNQNQASTITLLSVSFYLICTWLPATLVYSLERKFPFGKSDVPSGPVWERHFTYYTVRKFVEEVTLSNSACYFFIYYVTGKHFRTRFKEIIFPKRCLLRSANFSERGDAINGTTAITTTNGRSTTSRHHYIAIPCRTGNGHNSNLCVSSV